MEQGTQILDADGLKDFLNFTEDPKPKETSQEFENFFEEKKEEVETEEVTQTIDPPKEEEEKEIPTPKGNNYSELVKDLIESGDWGDYMVEVGEEEVAIKDLENIDKELFLQLKQSQEAYKEEQNKDKYISLEGVDDYTKKLIEISKEGGDISQLIQTQSQLINPVLQIKQNRDEQSLIDLVAFKMKNQNYDDDYINLKIQKFLKEGTLDEEADKVIEEIETNYNAHLEQTKKQLQDQKLQIEKERKEYKKTISEKLKPFNLKENDSRNIIKIASEYDEQGVSEADKLFYQIKQEDPERFVEIVMLMKDRELYNSIKFTSVKNKAELEAAKKILSLKPRVTTTPKEPQKKESALDNFFNTK